MSASYDFLPETFDILLTYTGHDGGHSIARNAHKNSPLSGIVTLLFGSGVEETEWSRIFKYL
jgi:hypothetical protein